MQRLKPGLDIVLDILLAVVDAQPHSEFAKSILHQYQERGGLSKKQLQGLYGKAQKLNNLPVAKLATLEAIILKKQEKTRSVLPDSKPMFEADKISMQIVESILLKYPAHKRVLFFQSKLKNKEQLTNPEKTELQKFQKLLA